MSKSGSRYGRRSNWFKIHCLLQEQQQQVAAAAATGSRKTPPPPTSMNMLGHTAYPPGMYPRAPCTKEELMLLGFDDYTQINKHSSSSPSVSSPDSHNSDSSVEVGDRRHSLLRQTQVPSRDQLLSAPFNKELFLPLSFPGLMPPPGFLPPSHLMFPGYHPALYAQHQGLLKPAIDPAILMSSSHNIGNNNNRFAPNHNSKSAEELTKRYLDAVLKSQRSPGPATIKSEEDDEDMENEDVVVSMTPPRSPPSGSCSIASASTIRDNIRPTATSVVVQQETPIDLSMKTGSSTSTDDANQFSGAESDGNISEDDDRDVKRLALDKKCKQLPDAYDQTEAFSVKSISLLGTTPLDLTTKV